MIGGVVGAVSSAATTMQSNAEGMSALAIETTRQSVTVAAASERSEEHTSELPSLMRISYAVFWLQKTTTTLEGHAAIPKEIQARDDDILDTGNEREAIK